MALTIKTIVVKINKGKYAPTAANTPLLALHQIVAAVVRPDISFDFFS